MSYEFTGWFNMWKISNLFFTTKFALVNPTLQLCFPDADQVSKNVCIELWKKL
jgi:hypothetical protein